MRKVAYTPKGLLRSSFRHLGRGIKNQVKRWGGGVKGIPKKVVVGAKARQQRPDIYRARRRSRSKWLGRGLAGGFVGHEVGRGLGFWGRRYPTERQRMIRAQNSGDIRKHYGPHPELAAQELKKAGIYNLVRDAVIDDELRKVNISGGLKTIRRLAGGVGRRATSPVRRYVGGFKLGRQMTGVRSHPVRGHIKGTSRTHRAGYRAGGK